MDDGETAKATGSRSGRRAFALAAVVSIAAGLMVGIWIGGSGASEAEAELDKLRQHELASLLDASDGGLRSGSSGPEDVAGRWVGRDLERKRLDFGKPDGISDRLVVVTAPGLVFAADIVGADADLPLLRVKTERLGQISRAVLGDSGGAFSEIRVLEPDVELAEFAAPSKTAVLSDPVAAVPEIPVLEAPKLPPRP